MGVIAPPIQESSHIFEVQFHPSKDDVVALCCVAGDVILYEIDHLQHRKLAQFVPDKDVVSSDDLRSVRSTRFIPDGSGLVTGSSTGYLRAFSLEETGLIETWQTRLHGDAVNTVRLLSNSVVAAGTDDGIIKLFDMRVRCPNAELTSFCEKGESVNALESAMDTNYLVGGLGEYLCVYDLRAGVRGKLEARSDEFGADILSMAVCCGSQKVVVGVENGDLEVFRWGAFGAAEENISGHQGSIDAMIKVDEHILVTGASDGYIRTVSMKPNKICGILARHCPTVSDDDVGVVGLAMNNSKTILASIGLDESVRFHELEASFTHKKDLDASRLDRGELNPGDTFFSDL